MKNIRCACYFLLVLLPTLTSFVHAQASVDPQLATIQAHLDRGDAAAALDLVNRVIRLGKPTAEALLLRSTALIMAGDMVNGFKDLQRALKMDSTLRQGWLNLAGLEIAEGRYDAAYKALIKARDLAPGEPDNDLNLGAVMALRGKTPEATEHFDRYLQTQPGSASACYVVAGNFALAGVETKAVEYLRQAVALDEHMRLRARGDERFLGLQSEAYRKVLTTDVYQPPADALVAEAAFDPPYRRDNPKLVYAVLESLKALGYDYNPTVEATDHWALIWGSRMRIKLFTQQNGTGVVRMHALAGRYTEDEWKRSTQGLFRTIYKNLEEPRLIQ